MGRKLVHGLASIRNGKRNTLYNRWNSMKQRCLNPKHTAYKNYGGRGIKVCDRWLTFDNYFEDISNSIGQCPGSGFQLDRIDNNKGYEPDNIRWASVKRNQNNKREFKSYVNKDIKRCNVCGRFLDPARAFYKKSTTCKKCTKNNRYLWKLDNPNYDKRSVRRAREGG